MRLLLNIDHYTPCMLPPHYNSFFYRAVFALRQFCGKRFLDPEPHITVRVWQKCLVLKRKGVREHHVTLTLTLHLSVTSLMLQSAVVEVGIWVHEVLSFKPIQALLGSTVNTFLRFLSFLNLWMSKSGPEKQVSAILWEKRDCTVIGKLNELCKREGYLSVCACVCAWEINGKSWMYH